jgi:hypothetical protein
VRPEIFGERARQHREPGFGGAVDGMVAQRPLRVHVDDVDDDAACGPQRRQQRLRQEQRRLQIAADEVVPLFRRHGAERCGVKVRRVVHEHIELARSCDDVLGHALEGGNVAHVCADGEGRARPRAIQLGGELLGIVGRTVIMNRDVRAGAVQRARDDGADAFRSARDEGPAPVESGVSFRPGHPVLQHSVFCGQGYTIDTRP